MAHIPLMERKLININNIMNNIIENNDGVKRKVRVYDFGEKVADRYTIVCVNYGKQFKYDREYLSFMLNVFKDEYKEHIKRDGIKKAFEDYIMSVPSIFRIHIADCDIRYLLRSWGVEFDEDDDEIYILYKRIIREVFLKMCEDMKVC